MKKTKIYLLHGWAVDANNQLKWQPLIDQLALLDIEAVFLSLPGLSTPLAEVWNLDNFVSWVLEQLPLEPVALLGHSFGGQLAIKLAAKHPDRVRQLILIASAGIRDQSLKAKAKRIGFGMLAKLGKLITKSQNARKLLYQVIGEQDYLNASPTLRQTMTRVITTDVQDEAARVQVSTLMIWGGRDRVTPPWMGRKFHRLIKNSRLEIIAPARHSPQFTHTGEVAGLIEHFLF